MARSKMVPLAARQMLPRLPGKVTPPGTQPSWKTIPLEPWNTTTQPLQNPSPQTTTPTTLLETKPPCCRTTPWNTSPWNTTPLEHTNTTPWTPGPLEHTTYMGQLIGALVEFNVSALLALWGV